MIEAAIQAPTWKNSQTGRYHVVMSQPLLDQLKEQGLARFNAENTHDAPGADRHHVCEGPQRI